MLSTAVLSSVIVRIKVLVKDINHCSAGECDSALLLNKYLLINDRLRNLERTAKRSKIIAIIYQGQTADITIIFFAKRA